MKLSENMYLIKQDFQESKGINFKKILYNNDWLIPAFRLSIVALSIVFVLVMFFYEYKKDFWSFSLNYLNWALLSFIIAFILSATTYFVDNVLMK